jgi:hypothetical protein
MQRLSRKVRVALLAIVLICILGLWFSTGPRDPALSVSYLGAVDGNGHWKLRFAITNVGKCAVFPTKSGEIEVANHTNVLVVGATAPVSQLAPGQGHVIDAVLSEPQLKSIDGRWRYTCRYAEVNLRSRIYQWQWGPNGPGARVNWLIPQKLKGMPLPVKFTSDWIEPLK